jgi:hypothetical protein
MLMDYCRAWDCLHVSDCCPSGGLWTLGYPGCLEHKLLHNVCDRRELAVLRICICTSLGKSLEIFDRAAVAQGSNHMEIRHLCEIAGYDMDHIDLGSPSPNSSARLFCANCVLTVRHHGPLTPVQRYCDVECLRCDRRFTIYGGMIIHVESKICSPGMTIIDLYSPAANCFHGRSRSSRQRTGRSWFKPGMTRS